MMNLNIPLGTIHKRCTLWGVFVIKRGPLKRFDVGGGRV